LGSQEIKIKYLIGIALFSRLLIFLIASVSSVIVDWIPNAPKFDTPFLDLFFKWDTGYYLGIAAYGYAGGGLSRWAFRPFYPFVLSLVGSFFTTSLGTLESFLTAGLIWNVFAFTLGTVYLYKLTKLLYDHESAYYTVLLISILPGSVFFTAVYPESTYLLLIVASFYYLEKEKIFRAVLLAALAGFTRPEGFLAFIPFAWKIFILKGAKRLELLIGSAIIVYTLPAFMLYGCMVTDDPYVSFKVESSWPKVTLFDMLIRGVKEPADKLIIYSISTAVLCIAVLSIAIYLHKLHSKELLPITLRLERHDKRMPYYLWAVLLLGVFLHQGGYAGLPRFTSPLFPILWGNVLWINKNPLRTYMLFSFYTCFMTLGTALFVNCYYFL
jgi:hypothetical protein